MNWQKFLLEILHEIKDHTSDNDSYEFYYNSKRNLK